MKKNEPVSHIMTREVHGIQTSETLLDVFHLIRKHQIRHVPVLEEKNLVGMISSTDINRLTFSGLFTNEEDPDEAILEMLTIRQVMTSHVRIVKESDTIKTVAEIFASEEFHALPVVDTKDTSRLVGIVTTTDVMRYLLDQF